MLGDNYPVTLGQKSSNDIGLLNFIGVETECINIPKKRNSNKNALFQLFNQKPNGPNLTLP